MCLATMAYVHAAAGFKFTELHALTLAARSYVLLGIPSFLPW